MAEVTRDLLSDETYTIGPVTGTLGGGPAPLPDSVVFTPSGACSLSVLDPVTVDVLPAGLGAYTVVVSCDGLNPTTITGVVSNAVQNADTLVVPISDNRKQ